MAFKREIFNTIPGIKVPKEVHKSRRYDLYDEERRNLGYTKLDMYHYLNYTSGNKLEYTLKQFKEFLDEFFRQVADKILYEGFILRMGYSIGRIYLQKSGRYVPFKQKDGTYKVGPNKKDFRKTFTVKWDKDDGPDKIKNISAWSYKRAYNFGYKVKLRLTRRTERDKTTPITGFDMAELKKIKDLDKQRNG